MSADEYTPSEDEVRASWIRAQGYTPEADVEFDRFLARIRAEAWDEGVGSGEYDHESSRIVADTPNPYRKEEDDD